MSRQPQDLKVLVACEESQRVCIAFRERGFTAFSCDIQECSGGHPEWHIQGDVLPVLNQKWDLIIAHPPCTYLTVSGARWFDRDKYGEEAIKRERERERGAEFFMQFTKAPCKHIAIENPIGYMNTHYMAADQIIQPYWFGHPERKATCLWLKGLPKLEPTNMVQPKIIVLQKRDGSGKTTFSIGPEYKWYSDPEERRRERSKTYQGVADAMAEQWGNYLLNPYPLSIFDLLDEEMTSG